jgi:hypothetical protein
MGASTDSREAETESCGVNGYFFAAPYLPRVRHRV